MKNGSYWRTGLPLLLKIVQPLPTQRGLTSFVRHHRLAVGIDDDAPVAGSRLGTGPGSAWIFFWISRPKPSE